MVTNEKTVFSTPCRHFEFGRMNEIIYLCRKLTNKSDSNAYLHQNSWRGILPLLFY